MLPVEPRLSLCVAMATLCEGVRGWKEEGERVSLSALPSDVRCLLFLCELASILWNTFITASAFLSSRDWRERAHMMSHDHSNDINFYQNFTKTALCIYIQC